MFSQFSIIMRFLSDHPGLTRILSGNTIEPDTKRLFGKFITRMCKERDPNRFLYESLKDALAIKVDFIEEE